MRNRGLVDLSAATAVLWPVALGGWIGARWARHQLARPERVRATLESVGIATRGKELQACRLGHGEMNAVILAELFGDGGDVERVVLKHSLRFGTFLGWAAREFGAMREYPRALGRDARFARETEALARLARAGIAAPRCLGRDERARVLALEWIDGVDLASCVVARPALAGELGRLLANMHALGVAMGDPNPRNFAVTAGDRLVPFDLEVAHLDASSVHKGFDVAWASAFLPAGAARTCFFDGYGPRGAVLDADIASARAHLDRYGLLIDLYAKRWRTA